MEVSRAFVTNISFPKSLNQLLNLITERGELDMEHLLEHSYVEWTAPKDAAVGDDVFFMHAVTSIDAIRRLRRELRENEEAFSRGECSALDDALDRAGALYAKYGAKIFATGKVCSHVVTSTVARDEGYHWRSIYYAPINSIKILEHPIDISKFRGFIKISRTGAITKLDPSQVNDLFALIKD